MRRVEFGSPKSTASDRGTVLCMSFGRGTSSRLLFYHHHKKPPPVRSYASYLSWPSNLLLYHVPHRHPRRLDGRYFAPTAHGRMQCPPWETQEMFGDLPKSGFERAGEKTRPSYLACAVVLGANRGGRLQQGVGPGGRTADGRDCTRVSRWKTPA